MKEKTLPNSEEKEKAASIISKWLGMDDQPDDGADIIRDILEEFIPGIEHAYVQRQIPMGSTILHNELLPRFLVDMMGVEIFEGDVGMEVRRHLLQGMLLKKPKRLKALYKSKYQVDVMEIDAETAFNILTDSKKTRWKPGGRFAQNFVAKFGFPPVFAGITSEPTPERVEEVYPRTPYHKLAGFQENMKNQILEMLESETASRRGIVSLPTGAGKTKTVVEAVIEFWKKKSPNTRFILWIAQTDELCEQAFSCFKQIWEEKGTTGLSLNIFRAWKGKGVPDPGESGIIVAGIRQLGESVRRSNTSGEDTDLSRSSEYLGAVFIDEAHKSWAPEYRRVLNEIGIEASPNAYERIPMIGLTATPERTAAGETEKLRRFYGDKIIHPSNTYEPSSEHGNQFDRSWSSISKMRKKLTEQRYLADPCYHYENPGEEFDMSGDEAEFFKENHMLDASLFRRIGTNAIRNAATYKILKKWVVDKKRQVLFFGANKHQALLMSRFLEDDGIRSATITGETRYGARKAHIRMFREREIQVLCNYEVLATGFDVPQIDTIIIARPTDSRIVYQQMVGRGLRGPVFGGTEKCDIITLEDKIRDNMNSEIKLGYMKYKDDLGTDVV